MTSRRTELLAFLALLLAAASLFKDFQPSLPATAAPLQRSELSLLAQDTTNLPQTFNYQGTLRLANGILANGTYTITLSLYDAPTAGTLLHRETVTDVAVRNGLFTILLGDEAGNPIDPSDLAAAPRYLGIAIAPDAEMQPRQRIHPVPLSLLASHAAGLTASDGEPADAVYVDDEGNVGVNTMNPTVRLHVDGPIMASALGTTAGVHNEFMASIAPGYSVPDFSNRELRIQMATNLGAFNQFILYNGRITKFEPGDNQWDPNKLAVTQGVWGRFSGIEFHTQGGISFMVGDGQYSGQDEIPNMTPKYALSITENGDTWIQRDLRLGSNFRAPVLIRRYSSLGPDANIVIEGVSPSEYDCVAASWSIHMDVDEDDEGPYSLWTYVEGVEPAWQWKLRSRYWTDSSEESKVDVLCFLRGIISQYEGDRSDMGFN